MNGLFRIICLFYGTLMSLFGTHTLADIHSFQKAGVPAELRPNVLRNVGIEQKLGSRLFIDATFLDELGRNVRISEFLGSKPILLVPLYFGCSHTCPKILDSVVETVREMKLRLGQDYRIVAFSLDPNDGPKKALGRKRVVFGKLQNSPLDDENRNWVFLTGPQESIDQLTSSFGYRAQRDESSGDISHASAIVVVTPEGIISQYFFGIAYGSEELRLALIHASKERIGSWKDQVFLYCFHYDPATGKYAPTIFKILNLLCSSTVLGLILIFVIESRRRRQHDSPV